MSIARQPYETKTKKKTFTGSETMLLLHVWRVQLSVRIDDMGSSSLVLRLGNEIFMLKYRRYIFLVSQKSNVGRNNFGL